MTNTKIKQTKTLSACLKIHLKWQIQHQSDKNNLNLSQNTIKMTNTKKSWQINKNTLRLSENTIAMTNPTPSWQKQSQPVPKYNTNDKYKKSWQINKNTRPLSQNTLKVTKTMSTCLKPARRATPLLSTGWAACQEKMSQTPFNNNSLKN